MRSQKIRLFALLFGILLLGGCGTSTPMDPSGAESPAATEELTMIVQPEDLAQLDALPQLKKVDFSGSDCYDEILAWAEAHPQVETRYTVLLPNGNMVDNRQESMDLSALPPEQQAQIPPLLKYLPELKSIKLSGDTVISTELLQQFLDVRPDIRYAYTLSLLTGTVDADTRVLSFIGRDGEDAKALAAVLPYLPALRQVTLGSEEASPELDWEDIAMLQKLRPDVEFPYTFTLYDRSFSTLDETMNFSHFPMSDGGEAVWQVLPCMQKLTYLDMDSCGIDNETMAAIRDQYPDTTVVWRVWFGDYYSARTDAIKILASNPGVGGSLMPGTYENLQYFTKLKYLDVGHQPMLDDISFVSYMPDLEVAILAMGCWSDATPLADCPHLEFLEIQTTNVTDLSPLAGLKELRHLNIGHLFDLTDISPIYDLDLERLWIGTMTPIPEEQVEEYQRRHPDCVVNTEGYDPHYMWRWIDADDEGNPIRDPRYDLLVEQFGYDREEYSFEWVETRGW